MNFCGRRAPIAIPDMLMQTQIRSWVSAGIVVLVFCWLGFLALTLGEIFKDLDARLPLITRLSVNYGPLGLPLLGALAAIGVMVASKFRRGVWFEAALLAALFILAVFVLRSLLISGVFMG